MLPNVDSGIFLDNDMLVLQDPAILWDRFKLFTPFTAIAVAPVEAHYSRQMVSSEQSCSFSPTSHLKLILSNNKCAVKLNFSMKIRMDNMVLRKILFPTLGFPDLASMLDLLS